MGEATGSPFWSAVKVVAWIAARQYARGRIVVPHGPMLKDGAVIGTVITIENEPPPSALVIDMMNGNQMSADDALADD